MTDHKAHTVSQYDKELTKLRENLMYLGALVDRAVANAMKAIVDRDSDLARQVIADDDAVDRLDEVTEELSIRLLALRQPAASDLRFITTAIKTNGHLERIGDIAAKIAEKCLLLNQETPLKPYIDLPRMAEISRSMMHRSLEAMIKEDVALACEVRRDDEIVDSLNEQIFRELITFMMEDAKTITRALLVMQVSKNMERISDHAKSIADMVIFMVTGKNVRHRQPSGEELR
ncbi:MAG: phosphate signaling complex protein PhoU [Deltaproteobacteria bacterium]|nr:phosphate signaling complex protein PhoU [Deltaproteobacteria bacterium]